LWPKSYGIKGISRRLPGAAPAPTPAFDSRTQERAKICLNLKIKFGSALCFFVAAPFVSTDNEVAT